MFTVKTPRVQLQAGDKVAVSGYKKPLTVVAIAGLQARLRTANGQRVMIISKEFKRVVTKMSEVIR